MHMQIKEFAKLTGVSVRTLHYYDQIGLLKPSRVDTRSGYRFYDEKSLLRMQQILFYRELEFSLESIRQILLQPNYDKETALAQQKKLLILKKERLERLIGAIDGAMKGENIMQAFDNSEFERYKAEAKQRWGETNAYKQHAEKTRDYSKDQWNDLTAGMDAIFAEFAQCMASGQLPQSDVAQALVKQLQDFITANYYTCTKQILAGLGQMYVADERFKNNMDQHGEGTAAFVSKAIEVYCK